MRGVIVVEKLSKIVRDEIAATHAAILSDIKIYCHGNKSKYDTFRKYAIDMLYHKACKPEDVLDRCIILSNAKGAVTHERMTLRYGDEKGTRYFKDYCEFQRLKNTKEYLMKVKGMSVDDVIDYNKSRSITLSNMIKKYGDDVGAKKYKEYCEKQAVNGCTLEYFIDKFGFENGTAEYKRICNLKKYSYDNLSKRYGHDKAVELLKAKTINYKSKASIKFFDMLDKKLKENFGDIKTYYGDAEYSVYDENNRCVYFYDYVSIQLGICVEYNGSIWHANSKKYVSTDKPLIGFNIDKTAAEIWEYDETKKSCIMRNRNIKKHYVVWDDDVNDAIDTILNGVKENLVNV